MINVRNWGFRKQLSIGISLISFLSVAISGALSYYFTAAIVGSLTSAGLDEKIQSVRAAIQVSHEDLIERAKTLTDFWSHDAIARLKIDDKKSVVMQAKNQVTQVSETFQFPAVTIDGVDLKSTSSWVDRVRSEAGLVATIFMFDPKGLVRMSTSVTKTDGTRATGTFIPNDSPVYKSIASGTRFVGRAQVVGQWYMTSYEPIIVGGRTVGAVFIGSPDTAAERIKNLLRKQKILDTGYYYILDSSGTLVLHPFTEGKNLLEATDADGNKIFKEMIEKKDGIVDYRWLNGETHQIQNKIAIFHYFPELDWYVAASLNRAEAEASLSQLQKIALGTTLFMTFFMVIITLLFGKRVSDRFQGVLQDLSLASSEVQSGASQLGSSSEELVASNVEQSASLGSTVSALEEIRSTTAANLNSTGKTTQLSNEMEKKAHEGKAVLDQLFVTITKIADENASANQQLLKSNGQISSIIRMISNLEEKTRLINDIVFQTKLLSFNASVEAARAGEHGRGFSVVAEEIGRLAELSGRAANEIHSSVEANSLHISEIIKSTQEQIESLSVASTENTREGVRVTQSCQATFEIILAQITDVNSSIQVISQASTEQAKGIEDISRSMHELEAANQKNAEVAVESRTLGQVLDESSERLEKSVHNLESFLHGTSYDPREKRSA